MDAANDRKRSSGGCPVNEDFDMLWASYRSAHNRKETEVAQERLSTYIRLWVEKGVWSVTTSPMISTASDRFGLLGPCIAFDLPGTMWLLSKQPSGLVTALEEYIAVLSYQLVHALKQTTDCPCEQVDKSQSCSPPGKDLQDMGPPGKDLQDMGSPGKDLQDMGPPSKDLQDMGPPGKDLQDMGPQGKDLQDMGPPSKDLQDMGPPDKDLQDMGPPDKDLQDMGPPDKYTGDCEMCPLTSVIEVSQLLQDSANLSTLLARVAGCAENYVELRKSNIIPPSIIYLQCLLNMVSSACEENLTGLISSLNFTVAFIHAVMDPRRQWQQRFMSLHTLSDPSLSNIIQVPSLVLKVFVDAFNQKWEVAKVRPEEWSNFQFGLLHMLGAMLCSSKDNASNAASQEVSFLLLALLDPRERCTDIQVLATKVFVKLVHVLHNTVVLETQTAVDSGVMLVGFLNVLSPRFHADGLTPPCMRMVISMMDIVPQLMTPPGNMPVLRQLFVDVGCYEKICEVLSLVMDEAKQDLEEAGILVRQVFASFSIVMERSEMLRDGFEQRVGHTKLAELVSAVTPPTKAILQSALNMAVEGVYSFQKDTHTVYNTSAVTMLIRWLLKLYPDLCEWLSARLLDMCSCGANNKQRCCTGGLITMVTEVLASSQQQDEQLVGVVEDNLIGLIEVLGAHSVRAVELKQLIGLLRPLENGELPTYYHRLQRALSVMAHRLGKEGIAPLYYFDLRTTGSCIYIPDLRHFPNSTCLTFHSWVSLDYPRTATGHDLFSQNRMTTRRVLYSFYTTSGTGFEAFFTSSLVLVVATVTKKEFITVALKECPLTPLEWHSISLVFHVPKRPWSKSELHVYIDGLPKRVAIMKTPNFSDMYTSSCIGFAPSRGGGHSLPLSSSVVTNPPSPSLSHGSSSSGGSLDLDVCPTPSLMSIPIGSVVKEWGHVTNLHGLISSLCVFGDAVSANSIKTLHRRGPNDLSLFQPKCTETQDLATKLFIYFHAKTVLGNVCVDLSPSHVSNKELYGRFNGQHYLTWDIKAVLGSLGGVELLYPILEQVHLPVRKQRVNAEQKVSECLKEDYSERDLDKVTPLEDKADESDAGVIEILLPTPVTPSGSTAEHKSWWFGEKEGVASFIKLLLSMLKSSPINQQVFFLSEGPATIGALLQKVPFSRITVQALSAAQELVEHFNGVAEQRSIMYKTILFDFRIWSRPEFSVRIGHTQYISTLVKDHTPECRRNFGVQYLLDVIRVFYSSIGNKVHANDSVKLTEEEQQSIRAALFSNIKFYVMYNIHWDEVEAVLSFLAAATDSHIQEEILRLVYKLLKEANSHYILGELLWEKGLHFLVLIRAKSMSVRLLAIKIIAHLNSQHSYNENSPLYIGMRNGSLAAAIGHMTEHNMSSSIILALLELCMATNNINCAEYISNFSIYVSVLQLLRRAPLDVRHTICYDLLSILHHTPTHVIDITSHGWESLFFWLLTPFMPPQSGSGTNNTGGEQEGNTGGEQEDVEKTELDYNGSPITYMRVKSLKRKNGRRGIEDSDCDVSDSGQNEEDGQLCPIPVTTSSTPPPHSDHTPPHSDHTLPSHSDYPGSVACSVLIPKLSGDDELYPIPVVAGDSGPITGGSEEPITGGSGGGLSPTVRESPRLKSHLEPADRPTSMPILDTNDLPIEDTSRRRTDAFLNSKTKGKREIVITGNSVVDRKNSFSRKRQSITYSTSWDNLLDSDSEDVRRTCSVVTETVAYLLWHSVDYDIGNPPWKVWGRFFASLDLFAHDHSLIIPAHMIKQRILILIMHAVTMDIKEKGVDHTALLDLMLQLSQLVESFIITTYPHLQSKEDQDVLLLKLAHNFVPDVDTRHCSVELMESYLNMLTSAKLFDSSHGSGLALEIVQSAIRVLLSCAANENKDYYVAACLKLEHLLRNLSLSKAEVNFILSNLVRIMSESLDNEDDERSEFISAVVRKLFSHHMGKLQLIGHVASLPSPEAPTFSSEFLKYSRTQEWLEYKEGLLKTEEALYNTVLLPWLHTMSGREQECQELANQAERDRREASQSDQEKFREISEQIYTLYEVESQRQRSVDIQQRNELSGTLQRWKRSRRFFTGERGAWSARHEDPYLWKLDRTENFSRMRMRLARNYHFNTHMDASQLRDIGSIPQSSSESLTAGSELLAKVVRRQSSVFLVDEDDYLLDQVWSDANAPSSREDSFVGEEAPDYGKESTVKSVQCSVIMLMCCTPGTLEVTTKHLYFSCDSQEKKDSHAWYSTDFKVPLNQLLEIYLRRYNMSSTALEIFLVDQTNYFINFPDKKTVQKVRSAILSLHPPNLNRAALRPPVRLLQTSGLTQKWVKREIDNFEYIMQLNTIAGRTYNDLNQYPVFPWILVDYESDKLDLNDPKIFRDLSKPVGIQRPYNEDKARERYEELDDPIMGRFNFGSHYSNAAGVLHYLIRLEPFTTLHVELQSGKFDYADRQFFSIPSTWDGIYNSGSDVKELIPEFFYLPELLRNLNHFNLGKLQTGLVLGDVILPPWASSPEDFIRKHMDALESDYVSANLNNWIDLIFGYKQRGVEAEKACNVFNYYCYEENVNLESIKDPREKRQIESIINNFGQTPTQLFTEPHPHRMSLEASRRNQAKGFTAFIGRKNVVGLFDNLSSLKAHCVSILEGDPVVFAGVPTIQTRALLINGNPESLVTVTRSGLLYVHSWVPFSNSKIRSFNFQFDPNIHSDRSRWQYLGGPFVQDLDINYHLFVLSPNNKILATAGHWDNSLRVHSLERNKIIARLTHHNDIVTCLASDKTGSGELLVTGSRDTTCAIWKFGTNYSDIKMQPLQTLYGHDSEILCADISTELDLVISGAKDGTCLMHTVRQGSYIHTLHPREDKRCEIHHVSISGRGRLIIYTEDKSMRQRAISAVPPCIHLYTINGHLLEEKELSECLNTVVVVDRYLITGNTRGFITFRDLYTLRQLSCLNLLEPVRTIAVTLDHATKVCTHLLVGLENGKLIIVSAKDLLQQDK